jgi:hypothetical protein
MLFMTSKTVFLGSFRMRGDAIAHEIGHLLKGSHSHSATGIMSGHWHRRELEAAARNALDFTKEDADAVKARLEAREAPI